VGLLEQLVKSVLWVRVELRARQVWLAPREVRASREPPGLVGFRELPGFRVPQVYLALQDNRVRPASVETPALQDSRVRRDQLVQPVSKVISDRPDSQGLLALLELLEEPERLETLDQQARLDRLDPRVLLGQQDRLVIREALVALEAQEALAPKVKLV
jgi:hypothetical protein